jgi:hypothetical protein
MSTNALTQPPLIRDGRLGKRIIHSELVDSISGSTGFVASAYKINPGNPITFPYLSVQAQRFEQYRFHKLEFHYLTRAPTSSYGSVMLAPDYDAGDSAPPSEVQASAYQDTVEDVPWRNQTCRLSVDSMFPSGSRKYIRDGNAAGDIRLYDSGTLFVCTLDQADTSAIGKLWVTYDVEFFVPQIENSSPLPNNSALARPTGSQAYTTTVAATRVYDAFIYNTLGVTVNAGVFTLPRGAYWIVAELDARSDAAGAFTASARLLKNGVVTAVPVDCLVQYTNTGTPATAAHLFLQTFVVSDGDDTVEILETITGAGNLSSQPNATRLTIRCA